MARRLVTIPISHFCEKARWALDRAGVDYAEERHVQGIHRIAARRAGGASTVPVLVTTEAVLSESEDIVAFADRRCPPERRLLPGDAGERRGALALSRRLDAEFGPAGRLLMYSHMLPLRRLMLTVNCQGVPRWEQRLLAATWPLAVRWAGRELGLHPRSVAAAESVVWRTLDEVAALLADGRPHLLGSRLTVADLTFAALAAAVVVPRQYGVRLPQPDALPPRTGDLVRRARAHPAGAYALRLFADER